MSSVYCETTLNYSDADGAAIVPVAIHNGRDQLADRDFDECGFTLLQHQSAVRDWCDHDHVADVHRPEIEVLANQFLGCDTALVYQPLIRSPAAAMDQADYAPIEFVHSDFTEDYRPMVQEEGRPYQEFFVGLLREQGLGLEDIRAAKRVVMLQFWRNTGAARPDRPFALCDASSVPRSDLSVFTVPEYGGEQLEFQTFSVQPPPVSGAHRWFTFPELTDGEVVLLRTYDSRCIDENRAFWTPHSAFVDTTVGPDAPLRESVEMRALCLFN